MVMKFNIEKYGLSILERYGFKGEYDKNSKELSMVYIIDKYSKIIIYEDGVFVIDIKYKKNMIGDMLFELPHFIIDMAIEGIIHVGISGI